MLEKQPPSFFASVAEFERELIRERVRSGLAAARARGKRLGRPRKTVDAIEIAALRAQGYSWARIAQRLGVGIGTAYRAFRPVVWDVLLYNLHRGYNSDHVTGVVVEPHRTTPC